MKKLRIIGGSLVASIALVLGGITACGHTDTPTPQPTPPTTVLVTGIAVSGAGGATSVTNGNTLQMGATPAPSNATNSSVSWSVVAGTGTATISSSGLLSATSVGTVTVKATANDGSGVVGSEVITITAGTAPDRIAYWQSGPTSSQACGGACEDIYFANPNGSGPAQLTTDPDQDVSPSWFKGQKVLAFVKSWPNASQDIWTMDTATLVQTHVPNTTAGVINYPAPSPDGTLFAFVGTFTVAGAKETGIGIMNVDGSGVRQLTHTPCNGNSCPLLTHPTWKPDGTAIAFGNPSGNIQQITITDLSGNLTNLSNNTFDEGSPAWSPDGTKIAFTSNRAGAYELFTMSATNGSGVKQLTFAPTTANGNAQNLAQAIMTQVLESTWSSDSNTVAFSNTNNGTSNIFSIAAAGGAVTQVTTTQSRSPTWH